MTRSELRERLRAEVLRGNHEGFTDLTALTYPVTYDTGRPNEPRFIQTEVTVLEKTPQYIHLAVAVSDGGVSAFAPVTEDPEDPGPRGPRQDPAREYSRSGEDSAGSRGDEGPMPPCER